MKLQQQEIEYLKAETQALMQSCEEKYIEAIQDYEYTLDRDKIKVLYFKLSSFIAKSDYRK